MLLIIIHYSLLIEVARPTELEPEKLSCERCPHWFYS